VKRIAWALWLPCAVLLAWQIGSAAGWANRALFPPPSELARAAARMIASGELAANAGATLLRTVAGFSLGSAAGLMLGLSMGGFPGVRRTFDPVVSALNATPRLSLLPLLLLFLGITDSARIAIIALSSMITVAIAAFEAVGNIHPAWVQLAVNYGARRWNLATAVYLPGCLPQLFTGLRLALGHALVMAVSTELVLPSTGLGSMIWLAWQTFSTDRLYVAIAFTGLLGVGQDWALKRAERRCIPWKVRDGD